MRAALPVAFVLCAAIAAAQTTLSTNSPIQNLATDFHGSTLYFTTSLRQRGTTQSAISKVFGLSAAGLQLIQQSSFNSIVPGAPIYGRPSVSGDGAVLAINWHGYCLGGSFCLFQNSNASLIRTPAGGMNIAGLANVSPNGRFVLVYGTGHLGAPGGLPPAVPGQVKLLDLTTGNTAVIGQNAPGDGQLVANDGTALVQTGANIQLVGPKGNATFTPAAQMNHVQLSADAGRILYDTFRADGGIRVLEVASGIDRQVAPGSFPRLAEDGRRFSFLNGNQVWLGDALSGPVSALTQEPEGIAEQTVAGDGSVVFAATNSGRVLSIDVASGNLTQLLGSTPPGFTALGATAVPGSYNWLTGTNDASLQIRVNGVAAIILGASPDRLLIQVPWEVQPDASAASVVWGAEPAWEQVVGIGVPVAAGVTLPLDSTGDLAVHEDWSRLVTGNDPAHPGEIIHIYGTGSGAIDGAVPSGKPTPADRLYRITAPCHWSAAGNIVQADRPLDVPFAGLAPGLTGIYQFDLRIPPDWQYQTFIAGCRITSGSYGSTGVIPVAPSGGLRTV